MLNNCSYNKAKLLHELCSLTWFIDKHAIKDAETAKDENCKETLQNLKKDLVSHIEKLNKDFCSCKV